MQSALLFMTCHEQITEMCFLLRCQFFPLSVTDGSQCYYRNRLIFLMSQFNRLQHLNVAAHPCQTICTSKTFGKTKKALLSDSSVLYKFRTVGLDTQINNRRGGNCTCKQEAGNLCEEILERPLSPWLSSDSHKVQVYLHNIFSFPFLLTRRKSICHFFHDNTPFRVPLRKEGPIRGAGWLIRLQQFILPVSDHGGDDTGL